MFIVVSRFRHLIVCYSRISLAAFLMEWIRFAGRSIGSSPCNDLVVVRVKFNISPFKSNWFDKNGNLLVRVYRPGLVGSPHLIPQETTPMAAHRSSTMDIISGPPLSPWKTNNKEIERIGHSRWIWGGNYGQLKLGRPDPYRPQRAKQKWDYLTYKWSPQ